MCDFVSTSLLVALPIYSFHYVRDKSFYYQVCVVVRGGGGEGERAGGSNFVSVFN